MQQSIHEGLNEEEEDIDTQEYELVIDDHNGTKQQAEEESTDEGEQNQEDIDTQDYNDFHEHENNNGGEKH